MVKRLAKGEPWAEPLRLGVAIWTAARIPFRPEIPMKLRPAPVAAVLLATGCAPAPTGSGSDPFASADAPVASAAGVASATYSAAAAVAARGGTPLEISLAVVGPFDGRAQRITQINQGAEAPTASRVTIVRDGLFDDAVRALRWDIALERTQAGGWRIAEVKRAVRCRRGADTERFVAGPCP
jgi:hypothetical protein